MKKLLLLFLLVLVASSCANREAVKPMNTDKSKTYRVGLGMMEKHALYNRGFTFQLQEGEPFRPSIQILNEMPETNTFELYFLLDYKQTAVNYGGKQLKTIRMETAPNGSGQLDVELTGLPAGRHELLLVAVRNPDKPLMTDQLVSPMETYYYRRATLLIGSDKVTEPAFQEVAVGQLEGSKVRNVFLTRPKPTSLNDMLKRFKHEPGSSYDLHFFTRPEVEKYAVTALVNNEQAEQPVHFIRKTERKEGLISLPFAFEPPSGRPLSDLTLIVVENPFERIDDEAGTYTKIPWMVYFNNKITVE